MIFWQIWPLKCLILMILTITKYHENLLRESTLSLLFMVKFFSSLETKMIPKKPNETFLRITRYHERFSLSFPPFCLTFLRTRLVKFPLSAFFSPISYIREFIDSSSKIYYRAKNYMYKESKIPNTFHFLFLLAAKARLYFNSVEPFITSRHFCSGVAGQWPK